MAAGACAMFFLSELSWPESFSGGETALSMGTRADWFLRSADGRCRSLNAGAEMWHVGAIVNGFRADSVGDSGSAAIDSESSSMTRSIAGKQ
jgi:hypothetical protein